MRDDLESPNLLVLPARFAPLIAAIAVFLLVYGTELANFSLSIDEEVATLNLGFFPNADQATIAGAWLSQGRWGMTLLTWILPNYEAIPFLSTLLFGVGLCFAAFCGIRSFGLQGARAYLFAVVHTGFPLWLHIAQFNTLAGGFGFGIAAAAFGAGLAVRAGHARERVVAVLLLAFAFSAYQTLTFYAVVFALFALHAVHDVRLREGGDTGLRTYFDRRSVWVIATFIAAMLAYWVIQFLAMWISGIQFSYIDGYLKIGRLLAEPASVLANSAAAIVPFLDGRASMYLGWGVAILLPTWVGLLWWLSPWGASGARPGARRMLFLCVLLLAFVLMMVPFVLSAGSLPARAHLVWPLLAAWLATYAPSGWEGRISRKLFVLALAYFSIIACSIGSTLFHVDRTVRIADAGLTWALLPAMYDAAGPDAAARMTFTLSGQRAFPSDGQLQRAEVFGTSFFEHYGGNVRRVDLYIRMMGVRGFDSVWLSERPDLLPGIAAMPSWPAKGSVRRINGVIVIKLGPPTPEQLRPAP